MKTQLQMARELAWRERRAVISSGIRLRSKTWGKQDRDPRATRRDWRKERSQWM
jgi:hypothetical protein